MYPVFVLLMAASCGVEQGHRQDINVTYTGNAGFLIESGTHKILVDALFGGFKSNWCFEPTDSMTDLMINAKPPFDSIDVIAFTHYHRDHFDAEMTVKHLLHNRSGVVVCPHQVEQMLAKSEHYPEIRSRIHAISLPLDSPAVTTVSGIDIKSIRSRHQPSGVIDSVTGKTVDGNLNTEHLEFVFSCDGNTIYHAGDNSMDDMLRYQSYGFGNVPIDLAFIHWWDSNERLSFRQALVKDIIKPDRIILMHIEKDSKPIDNPDWQSRIAKQVILPDHQMQRWTLTPFAKYVKRD